MPNTAITIRFWVIMSARTEDREQQVWQTDRPVKYHEWSWNQKYIYRLVKKIKRLKAVDSF